MVAPKSEDLPEWCVEWNMHTNLLPPAAGAPFVKVQDREYFVCQVHRRTPRVRGENPKTMSIVFCRT